MIIMKVYGFIYLKINKKTTAIKIILCTSIIIETWNSVAIYTKKQKSDYIASIILLQSMALSIENI